MAQARHLGHNTADFSIFSLAKLTAVHVKLPRKEQFGYIWEFIDKARPYL